MLSPLASLASLATIVSLFPAANPPTQISNEIVRDRLGVSEVAVVELVDLAVRDGRLTAEIPLGTDVATVELESHSLRASSFRLEAWADGVTRTVPAPTTATMRGHLRGDLASVAAGGLFAGQLTLRIQTGAHAIWWVRPLTSLGFDARPSLHVVFRGDPPFPEGRVCGVDGDGDGDVHEHAGPTDSPDADLADSGRVTPTTLLNCPLTPLKLTEIAFDVDTPYYVNLGSDLAATIANVETHLAIVDAHYARDALITYVITRIIVRETPFYLPGATSLLDLFQAEWNTNQTAVPRDIAHLMTGQPAPGLAGLAYVAVVCNTPWVYGWSVDWTGVVSHELGHNWAAGHCHDTAPCNNMCGACLLITPNTKEIIEAFRDSRTCLDDAPPFASPLPPYAHPESVVLARDEADLRTPRTIDVLANDHDANCDRIAIDSYDPTTLSGGAVGRSSGTGPGGRDELIYTPPCTLLAGTDRFSYTIADPSPETSTTTVTVDVHDDTLAGYWPLDDGAGSVAADATAYARNGTLTGVGSWVAGHHAGALELNGVDAFVTVPPVNIDGRSVTITAWIRRAGPQAPWPAIVMSRGAGTTAALGFGDADELRYHWSDGDPATYNWNPRLVVPDGQWAFVALVVEPTAATIYLHDGTTMNSATNPIAHIPQTFAAGTDIGRDPVGGSRYFRGTVDDVRLYNHALSASDLTELAELGGRATAPHPADGGFLGIPDADLSWSPGHGATSYDVYFGTDYRAVRDATPAAPEFRGNVVGTRLSSPGYMRGVTYFWRVDTHVGATILPGEVWLFGFQGEPRGLLGYWPLDDATGTVTNDATRGGRDGTLMNGPVWTAGTYGGGIELDGVNDHVVVPPLSWAGTSATLTAWVRRNGPQNPFAALVMSRGAGTTAGLNLGSADELRYHWNDDGATWGFDSGLVVPDSQWAFAALVLEPAQATLYLHDGATLRSAVNPVGHIAQTFAGDTSIGRDPTGGARYFRGRIDDVRVYDRALAAAEVDLLVRLGGPASAPRPPSGEIVATSPALLEWVGGVGADSHDLYFGTDFAAVRDATTASVEFRGNQIGTSFPLATIAQPGQSYFWRVDEHAGAAVIPGSVWRFARAAAIGNTLLAVKAPTGEPALTWVELGNHRLYEIGRCAPPTPGSCTPAAIASVGPYVSSWVDPAAGANLLWYQVAALVGCTP